MTTKQDRKYYIIVSEAVMADFLTQGEDDDLLNKLIRITEYDSEEERAEYLARTK